MQPRIKVFDSSLKNTITEFDAYASSFKGGAYTAASDNTVISGAGVNGGPQVRFFDTKGKSKGNDFFAFDKKFRGGVSVASGDINGDGVNETITAAGPKGGPQVRVFNNKNEPILQFFAYNKNFRGGILVASGDVNGDGKDEIITGTGPGGGPQVRIFNEKGSVIWQTFAFHKNFRGGISVASGDIDGDDKDDLIVSQLSQEQAWVKAYAVNEQKTIHANFLAFPAGFKGGAHVAAADVSGNGKAEIITGAGAGGSSQIRVFDGSGKWIGLQAVAFDKDYSGGVLVEAADINGDKKAEIIASPSPIKISREKCQKNCVALTIDDGYSKGGSFESMIDTLNRRNVKATFFIIGRVMQGRPDLMKKIVSDGHLLANHSYTHGFFTRMPNGQIVHELTYSNDIAKSITGKETKPYFRYPYGSHDGRTDSVVSSLGYRYYGWTADSYDSRGGASVGSITTHSLAGLRDGSIILIHTQSTPTARALDTIISMIQGRGFNLVRLDEMPDAPS